MVEESSIDSFQRDGAISIRQLFTPVEIALLRSDHQEHPLFPVWWRSE